MQLIRFGSCIPIKPPLKTYRTFLSLHQRERVFWGPVPAQDTGLLFMGCYRLPFDEQGRFGRTFLPGNYENGR